MTQSKIDVLKIVISTSTASVAAIWTYQTMTAIAYAERGYHAIGGEWAVIVLVPTLTFRWLTKLFDLKFTTKKDAPRRQSE